MQPKISEQSKVQAENALSVAHTEIHRALHALKHGSPLESKQQALSAVKKIINAIAML